MRAVYIAAAALTCWLFAVDASANQIVNPGFETGSFSDWTVNPASTGSFVFVAGHAHSGADAAWFGAVGSSDDQILQTFATTAGGNYTVSFWLAHGATDNRNGFNVWWDATPLLLLNNASRFNETHYTFTIHATSAETTLRFGGHALQDYYYLDDVNVAIANPEPATVLLVLGGAVATWRLRRRRR